MPSSYTSPNGKKLSCLLALVASSVVIPSAVYLVFTKEMAHLYEYANTRNSAEKKEEAVKRREFWNSQVRKGESIRRHCSQYGLDQVTLSQLPTKTLSSIIVDDEHKVMYCQVPKVACTNWRRIFLILTGQMNTTNPLHIHSDDAHHKYKDKLRYLNQYEPAEIRNKIQHYLKFMISREPLDRVLSAYRNKFVMKFSGTFHKAYGRKIIKRYRVNATESSRESGNDVTFPEFVKYLLDSKTVLEKPLNEHWVQQHKHCFPCTIHYDFIGKYESLTSDANNILHYIDSDLKLSFPSRDSTYSHPKTSESALRYLKQVPKEMLSDLYQMYYLDYKLFGYQFPRSLLDLNVTSKR